MRYLLHFVYLTIIFFSACRPLLPDNSSELGYLTKLNSPYLERNPIISSSGKFLFFMSTRGQQAWSQAAYSYYKRIPQYEGDIWLSKRGKDGTWQVPQCLGEGLNSLNSEDEPNISLDEEVLFFQRWQNDWIRSGGPYYQVNLGDNLWQIKGLGSEITRFFQERWAKGLPMATDGASFSPDGKILVFALGYYDARMDLYISHKQSNDRWSFPQKLSASTHRNDRSPFIAADSRTLYFSSNGYGKKKVGKMDIFRTTVLGGKRCGKVENLGEIINTKGNEQGFCLSLSGDTAVVVREQDLYLLDLNNLAEDLKPEPIVVIEGYTLHENNPEVCQIEVFSQDKRLAQQKSRASNGHFMLIITKPSDLNSVELYIQQSPQFESQKLSIPIDQSKRFIKIKQDITLNPRNF